MKCVQQSIIQVYLQKVKQIRHANGTTLPSEKWIQKKTKKREKNKKYCELPHARWLLLRPERLLLPRRGSAAGSRLRLLLRTERLLQFCAKKKIADRSPVKLRTSHFHPRNTQETKGWGSSDFLLGNPKQRKVMSITFASSIGMSLKK
jgi:hypothetical protein